MIYFNDQKLQTFLKKLSAEEKFDFYNSILNEKSLTSEKEKFLKIKLESRNKKKEIIENIKKSNLHKTKDQKSLMIKRINEDKKIEIKKREKFFNRFKIKKGD